MIKKILVFALVFSAWQMHAQTDNCVPTLPYEVNTASGMKMRSGPGTTFGVVATVPSKVKILVCKELSTAATFENKAGHWRKIKYKNHIGYMFDGFLTPTTSIDVPNLNPEDFTLDQLEIINQVLRDDPSKLDSVMTFLNQVAEKKDVKNLVDDAQKRTDSIAADARIQEEKKKAAIAKESNLPPALNFKLITEAYNYCGDIANLDPGKVWYAIYKKDQTFFMKRIDLLIVRSKYSLGSGLEFDIKADKDVAAQFLFTVGKRMDTVWHVTQSDDFFELNPKKLFPGQSIELYGTDPVASLENTTVFATGNVTNVGICPVMKDYKVQVTGEMHNKLITQNLTPQFSDLGDCGIPEIYWFGDLNGDKYPEIIFLSTGKNGLTFTLFVSDLHNQDVLYRKADEWLNHNCD